MPKGIQKFKISFGEKAITHFGGLFQIHKFCQKLKLKWLLQSYVKFNQPHQYYHTSELILFILYYIISGILRVHNTDTLQFNGVFKRLLGVKSFPNPTTIRRFLHALTLKDIHQIIRVHNLLQEKLFFVNCPQTSVVFDLDPTVLTVYGKQQKARVGYNPKARGKRCYSLFLCFESNHQEFWLGSLQSGDVHPVKLARRFLEDCIVKLPKKIKRIRIRADAAFYDHKFIEPLDEENIGYTIEAHITGPMQFIIPGLKYRHYKKDWEIAEFSYQPHYWKEPHRFVVERRPLPKDPEESAQLSFFTIRNYGYRVIVTNLNLKPRHIWNFHNQRAKGAELNIRELKHNYPLTKIPTQKYTANIAFLQLLLFAFNTINWYKRLCLPKGFRYKTLHTIRQDLLVIPARLVKVGHRNILKFPIGYPYKNLLQQVNRKIENLKI